MTFLNPLFLIGVSAFALPLLIHLIFKKKAKVVLFPSILFLREIDREIVRRKRLEEILVMILRMLVLVMFALFLSQPVLKTNLFGAGGKAAVILLDDSFSMNATNARRRFDVAKEKARLLIAGLDRGDKAALILTSKGPEGGFRKGILSSDRLGMSRWLDSLSCGYASSNLDEAFGQARAILRASDTKNRGIFLISDLQKRDWEAVANREKTEDIPVVLIDVAEESNPLNVAITKIEVLSAPEKRLGKTFTFRVEVRNFSSRPFDGRIGMYTDQGGAIAETGISLGGESTVEKEVRFQPAEDGWHSGYFLVEKDDLPTDNKRYYCLEVKEGIPLGIFNQVRIAPPDFDEVFFLSRLIDPAGQKYPFSVEEFFVISGETLGKYRVVIFPELPKLREGEMSALKTYVSSGGRAVFFLKAGFSLETLRSLFGSVVEKAEVEEGTFKVGEEGFGLESLFLDVDFYRRIPLSVSGEPQATAISLFQDGKPFLVEKREGSGKIVLFATGFHVDYTNLPFRHASLPLIYNLVFGLVGRGATAEYGVGEMLIVKPDWGSVTTPTGETVEFGLPSRFYRLEVPGVYEARVKGAGADSVVEKFPVNVSAEEGDLTPMKSDADIDKILPFRRWERVRSDEDLKAKLQAIITGTALKSYFLYAAVAAFLMELYLANKIGQKV